MEGEQAVKKQLVDNAGLNDVNPDELSGGKWICSFSHEKEPTGTAEYAVEIPQAGRYHLWVRAVGGTGLAYRVDGAKDAVRGGDRQGPGPDPRRRGRQPVLSADSRLVRPGHAGLDAGQAHHHLVPGRAEGEGPLGRHGLLRADHGRVHAQRQVQAGREVARADPRFPAGPGVGLRPRGGQVRPRRRAGPALPQREGGRRARFHPPEPRRQQLRARRRPADPLLGGARPVSSPKWTWPRGSTTPSSWPSAA